MSGESKPALGSVVAAVAFSSVFFSSCRLLASSSRLSFFALRRFRRDAEVTAKPKAPLEFRQLHVTLIA